VVEASKWLRAESWWRVNVIARSLWQAANFGAWPEQAMAVERSEENSLGEWLADAPIGFEFYAINKI